VSHHVDHETRARLASGDVLAEPQEPEEQHPEGVVARRQNGDRVFYDHTFMQVVKIRNRGKD
jgi:hypothetical protein